MSTDTGEFIVGAYLKVIESCDFVEHNIRVPGGGLSGLNELDVIGLNFENKTAYICEVTTHIRGVLYRDNATTVSKIAQKNVVQKAYADKFLSDFHVKHYMFWSPRVPVGFITDGLSNIPDLELVINHEYTRRVDLLREKARESTHSVGNPFFRTLQILEHLKR